MSGQPRVTIIYPALPDSRFDFGYYVPNHLPLAVGTSLRYSAITYCDADKPVGVDPPHKCLCVVGFETSAAMDDFRQFFATGHPETQRILADEPNYTDIRPLFVAGMAHCHGATPGVSARTAYRVRLMFPAKQGAQFDHDRFAGLSRALLWEPLRARYRLMGFDVDRMTAGVMPDSRPDYHCIWTGWCEDRAALDAFVTFWSGPGGDELRSRFAHATDAPVEFLAAEVVTLEMALACRVANPPQGGL